MKSITKLLITVLISMLLVGLAGVGYVIIVDRSEVASSAELVVSGKSTSSLDNAYSTSQYITSRMSTYVALATSEAVLGPAATSLGVDSNGLAGAVTATVVQNTTVLNVSVQGRTPAEAQRRTKAVTVALSRGITDLEMGTVGGSSVVAVTVLSSATEPAASTLPSPVRAGLIGLLIGFVLGFVFYFAGISVLTRRKSWRLTDAREFDAAEPGIIREAAATNDGWADSESGKGLAPRDSQRGSTSSRGAGQTD